MDSQIASGGASGSADVDPVIPFIVNDHVTNPSGDSVKVIPLTINDISAPSIHPIKL
jgi:hypothetical protein